MAVKFILTLAICVFVEESSGHGMMLDPPNRASLWRFDWKQPANYADNELFCGGVQAQWGENDGKCGVCGDAWTSPVPRSNENTGKFGNGIVTRTYKAGSVIETSATLTANHLGTFTYSLCVLKDPSKPEAEECFQNLKLADGSPVYYVSADDYIVKNKVQLPEGLTCERCVLRWHYKAGNSWGVCDDGSQRVGCGAQETFRSCADISIVN